MSDKNLAKLYAEHAGKVSDKWSIYLKEYNRVFDEYRDKPICLLEIGIQNGGSLEIWAKYFRNAKYLIGSDINPNCQKLIFQDSRISIVVGDANSNEARNRILNIAPSLDIVLDDGSHRSSDIIKSFSSYFPLLSDNGLFIVEDLHCSYWAEFEGGLLDPYSSVAFFKLLVEVINHEHWGITRTRQEILNGFFERYGFIISESDLEMIHSIQFINSMCIVRKNAPEHNRLGVRVVSGTKASVVENPIIFDKTLLIPPSQIKNYWSIRKIPPDQELSALELQLHSVKNKLKESNADNAALLTSTSWRITAPLRWVFIKIKKVLTIREIKNE